MNLARIFFVGATIVALTAGPTWATNPAAQTPESVPDSVSMRTWPPAANWSTELGSDPSTGRYCATYAVDGLGLFGLRTDTDPSKRLSVIVVGPKNEMLSARSVKLWVDGFLLGEFPVTRWLGSSHRVDIRAPVNDGAISALLDLFGTGARITVSAGGKTRSASLIDGDHALKAFRDCAHELATLNAAGATGDTEQVEGQTWVARCKLAAVMGARPDLGGSCQSICDRRTTFPGFAELDANLKSLESVARQLPSSVRNEIVAALQALGGTEAIYSAEPPLSQPETPPPAGQTAANLPMVPAAPGAAIAGTVPTTRWGKTQRSSEPTSLALLPTMRGNAGPRTRARWTSKKSACC
jgi:hypothetical protein